MSTEPHVKERLQRAALQLFNRKGYAATSVNEIVAEAGVTKPVLYYYFKNKEAIYLAILQEAYDRLWAVMDTESLVSGTAEERLLHLTHKIHDLFVQQIEAARLVYGVHYGPPQGVPPYDFLPHKFRYIATFRAIVDEGIAAGELAGAPEDIVFAVISILEVSMTANLACVEEMRPGQEGLERALRLLFQGIAAPVRSL